MSKSKEIEITIGKVQATSLPAGLYVIASPIGNMKDITLRALETLISVDLLACEDTRVTKQIYARYGVSHAPKMVVYNDHAEDKTRENVLSHIKEGSAVGLISDAGTPLISDPGYKLVRRCHEAGYPVYTIPGPSALTAALSISGLPTDKIAFEGFLPVKRMAREEALQIALKYGGTVAFYETASRLPESLEILADLNSDMTVVVARELTKTFEELLRGTPQELISHIESHGVKGEIVLLIGPDHSDQIAHTDESIKAMIFDEIKSGLSKRDAVRKVATVTGWSRGDVYDLALDLKE